MKVYSTKEEDMKEKFIELLEEALDYCGAGVVCESLCVVCDNNCGSCPVGSDSDMEDLIIELKR